MLKDVLFSVVLLSVAAAPAFAAEECGVAPIPPAFPAVDELSQKPVDAARKDVIDSFHLVKTYQGSLKTFRGCIEHLIDADKQEIESIKAKADKDGDPEAKVKAVENRIRARLAVNDKSVDSEQQVVAEFNTLRLGHCKRDTDAKVCPQPKK